MASNKDTTLNIINLVHGSDKWLEFRKSGIGGSDASAILGMNPWKTNIELFEEKAGIREPKPISNAEAVEYGIKAEKPLTELFKLDYPEYIVKTPKNIVYQRDGFMFASLDGELVERYGSKRKGILEVKTSAIFASMHKENWKDGIPQNYYIQILHYMLVTGFDFAVLKAHLRSTDKDGKPYIRHKHYIFERKDKLEDLEYLYQKEKEFWSYVERKVYPPCVLPTI